jgi:hypothetical protein
MTAPVVVVDSSTPSMTTQWKCRCGLAVPPEDNGAAREALKGRDLLRIT